MRLSIVWLLTPGLLAACGGGDSTTGPGPTGDAAVTATIDGTAFASTTAQVTGGGSGSNQVPGLLNIVATQVTGAGSYTTLNLNLGYLAGTGTYPLGVNPGTTAGGTGSIFAPQGAAFGTWSTNFTGAAGTVTVTSLTATRIAGTFQFTAPPQSFTQTTGTRAVTNGAFNVALPAGFTPAPPNDRGSRVSAVVGGVPWNGATVVALGTQTVFVYGGTTDSLSISIAPASVLAAGGTYPIGGLGGATMIVTRLPSGAAWSGGTGQPVGTMTITSLGNGRAAGTFSATLLPTTGAGASLAITQGTFDVKILISN